MIDRRKVIKYSPLAAARAKELRQNMTMGEAILWNCLKCKAVKGYDFNRQRPIGDFIDDFFCARLMLAIEVDGRSHWFRAEEDLSRQRRIESLGITFLRFTEESIREDVGPVVRAITQWIDEQEAGLPG